MNFPSQHKTTFSTGARKPRRAAATVEFAIIGPMLFMLSLGALEIGQFVNVGQAVSEASREGARFAARNGTTAVSDVESCVEDFLVGSFAGLPAKELAEALEVNVSDATGKPISGGDLTSVDAGEPIQVEVAFDFAAVRWIGGHYASQTILRTSTMACRE